jgi:DNA-binding XRE family transcriptional regulator
MLKCRLEKIRTDEYKMDLMDFASYLRVNYNTYRGWEKETSYPTLETAFDIAEKLKRSVDDIWHK